MYSRKCIWTHGIHFHKEVIQTQYNHTSYHQPQISSKGSAVNANWFACFEELQGQHKPTQNEEYQDPEVPMVYYGERRGVEHIRQVPHIFTVINVFLSWVWKELKSEMIKIHA